MTRLLDWLQEHVGDRLWYWRWRWRGHQVRKWPEDYCPLCWCHVRKAGWCQPCRDELHEARDAHGEDRS